MTTFESPLSSPETCLDATLHAVYADWLEERGDTSAALLHRWAAAYLSADWPTWNQATDQTSVQYALLQALGVNVQTTMADLNAANGRRRKRTLDVGDLLSCAIDAKRRADGWQSMGGGTVANAYGYRSYQTVCVAARRTNGTVRVGVAVANGNKGSSQTNAVCGLTKRARDDQFRSWADQE